MSSTKVAAQVSDLASNQWGLLTTTQAEAEGVSRLQLARLADAGVIERVDRGIYGIPAAMDERTELRAAWLSLEPKVAAEAPPATAKPVETARDAKADAGDEQARVAVREMSVAGDCIPTCNESARRLSPWP